MLLKIISNDPFVNKRSKLGNYIEGTCKKFPSTNFSHFPTHAHGIHYLLLISPDHSFFSFPKFPCLFNLQWLRCSLQSLFSSFPLLLLLYFLSHTGSAWCLHLVLFFFPFFFISFFFLLKFSITIFFFF